MRLRNKLLAMAMGAGIAACVYAATKPVLRPVEMVQVIPSTPQSILTHSALSHLVDTRFADGMAPITGDVTLEEVVVDMDGNPSFRRDNAPVTESTTYRASFKLERLAWKKNSGEDCVAGVLEIERGKDKIITINCMYDGFDGDKSYLEAHVIEPEKFKACLYIRSQNAEDGVVSATEAARCIDDTETIIINDPLHPKSSSHPVQVEFAREVYNTAIKQLGVEKKLEISILEKAIAENR